MSTLTLCCTVLLLMEFCGVFSHHLPLVGDTHCSVNTCHCHTTWWHCKSLSSKTVVTCSCNAPIWIYVVSQFCSAIMWQEHFCSDRLVQYCYDRHVQCDHVQWCCDRLLQCHYEVSLPYWPTSDSHRPHPTWHTASSCLPARTMYYSQVSVVIGRQRCISVNMVRHLYYCGVW